MLPRHYAHYGKLPAIALSLALQGHTKGFIALIQAENIDVKQIATFRSHSDHHLHDTFFLLYEVVKLPNPELLKYLIEVCGLSVTIREDWIKEQRDSSARLREQVNKSLSRVVLVEDSASRYLEVANPYRADTLIAFTEQEVTKRQRERDLIKNRQLNLFDTDVQDKLVMAEATLTAVEQCLAYLKSRQ